MIKAYSNEEAKFVHEEKINFKTLRHYCPIFTLCIETEFRRCQIIKDYM